tara:strand:- start:210 stop:377 length:168 start_codon:yes stop_codon:yes gene_type:complete
MNETQKRLERVAQDLRVGRITTDVARIAAVLEADREIKEAETKLHSLWDLMERGK